MVRSLIIASGIHSVLKVILRRVISPSDSSLSKSVGVKNMSVFFEKTYFMSFNISVPLPERIYSISKKS